LFRALDSCDPQEFKINAYSIYYYYFCRIDQNKLTGTLPSTIGLWTDLQAFYISGDPPLGNAFDFEVGIRL